MGSGEVVDGMERIMARRRVGLVSAAGSPVPARLLAADAAVLPGVSVVEETGGVPVLSRGEAVEEA